MTVEGSGRARIRPRIILAGLPVGLLSLGLTAALPTGADAVAAEGAPPKLAQEVTAERHVTAQEVTAQEVTAQEVTAQEVTVERRVALMGTRLELRVDAPDRLAALRASERAMRAVEATESRLSTWRPDTELARLNRAAPGEPVALSAELATELEAAEACWRETSGAFDPALGSLAAAWGLRTGAREPSEEQRLRALAATGMDGLELRRATPENPKDPVRAVRHRDGLILDEGGFGKGAGLRAAVAALADTEATSAALDLGGQWAFWRRHSGDGTRTDSHQELASHRDLAGEPGWRVAVADPRDRQRPVAAITVDGGSVATSGHSERAGHLLDPRDGRPADDFGSLTVWSSDPLWADCLSTGLYILGPDGALAWAERHPGVEVLVLTVNGGGADEGTERLTARATRGLAPRLETLTEGLAVEVSSPVPREPATRAPTLRPSRSDLQPKDVPPQTRGTTTFKRPASEPSSPKSRAVEDRATSQEEYTCRF